jgi:hypothetical protein
LCIRRAEKARRKDNQRKAEESDVRRHFTHTGTIEIHQGLEFATSQHSADPEIQTQSGDDRILA